MQAKKPTNREGHTDLFGQRARQESLFGAGEDRLQPPKQDTTPDPEDVRRRLRTLIEKVRSAEKMPWSERDARMWQTVFPNMAKWLPDDEASQLCLEFSTEMARLSEDQR